MRLLFCLICCLVFYKGIGQGNLEFSQVKLVGSTQETVPAGKIWKLESALSTSSLTISTGTTSPQNETTNIIINGTNIVIKSSWGSSYASSALEPTDLPIWLPAGTTLRAGTNVFRISVIEFNVIP
jgi:hypothetical protein